MEEGTGFVSAVLFIARDFDAIPEGFEEYVP